MPSARSSLENIVKQSKRLLLESIKDDGASDLQTILMNLNHLADEALSKWDDYYPE